MSEKRRVPIRGSDRALFLAAALAAVGAAVFTAVIYRDLPDTVPSHFDFSGEADAYASKSSIWMMPVMMALLIVVLYIVALFNTNTTKDGTELSDQGHRMIIGHMRRLLGILSLLMAIFAWEAVLIISGNVASPGVILTLTGMIPIAIAIAYSLRMYQVMKQDPGRRGQGPLL